MVRIKLDLFIPKKKVMFRYKILHGFFFPLFGNLSPSGHQIGNDATPGGKNPIYFIDVTKERLD